MSSPTATPSEPQGEEAKKQWDLDRVMNPVWKALTWHNTIDALKQAEMDVPDFRGVAMLAACRKFVETARDKQLVRAYDALGQYLMDKGLLRVHFPPGTAPGLPDSIQEALNSGDGTYRP